jgi:hypothetical protein
MQKQKKSQKLQFIWSLFHVGENHQSHPLTRGSTTVMTRVQVSELQQPEVKLFSLGNLYLIRKGIKVSWCQDLMLGQCSVLPPVVHLGMKLLLPLAVVVMRSYRWQCKRSFSLQILVKDSKLSQNSGQASLCLLKAQKPGIQFASGSPCWIKICPTVWVGGGGARAAVLEKVLSTQPSKKYSWNLILLPTTSLTHFPLFCLSMLYPVIQQRTNNPMPYQTRRQLLPQSLRNPLTPSIQKKTLSKMLNSPSKHFRSI